MITQFGRTPQAFGTKTDISVTFPKKFNHGTIEPSTGALTYKATADIQILVGRRGSSSPLNQGLYVDYLIPLGVASDLTAKWGFFVYDPDMVVVPATIGAAAAAGGAAAGGGATAAPGAGSSGGTTAAPSTSGVRRSLLGALETALLFAALSVLVV